jgi:hypothetical protein
VDDSPQPPGGFQKEIEQAAQTAQQFAASEPRPPVAAPLMPPPNDLYSRPHFMDGGWNVSADRTHWWDGTAWVPGRPPGAMRPSSPTGFAASPVAALIALAVLIVLGLIAFSFCQSIPTAPGVGP